MGPNRYYHYLCIGWSYKGQRQVYLCIFTSRMSGARLSKDRVIGFEKKRRRYYMLDSSISLFRPRAESSAALPHACGLCALQPAWCPRDRSTVCLIRSLGSLDILPPFGIRGWRRSNKIKPLQFRLISVPLACTPSTAVLQNVHSFM